MSESDPAEARAVRPSRPQPIARPPGGRPVRPITGVDVTANVEPPVAESPVAAPPPPIARPSVFGSRFLFRTMIPPCAVLAVGFNTLGVAYVGQPPDAALRALPPAVAWTAFALAGLAAACAALLASAVRRR